MLVRKLAPRFYDDYRPSLMPRPMTLFLKQLFGTKVLVGVEIGVYTAHNSESILKTLNVRKLFLIDPYIFYQENDNAIINVDDSVKKQAINRMKPYTEQVEWLFQPSEEASTHVPSNLDFVYIDGNHSYNYVTKDIQLYYEKLKKSGVLGGHDFTLRYYPEVCYAVVEFARQHSLNLQGDVTDWWVIKK